jgi:DNA-binding NarL/FixJ family response regulator
MTEKISVLIAHELKLISESLAYLFKAKGNFEVLDTPSDGKEFIQQINKEAPDLALIDIDLPGLNGIEATRMLREKNKKAKVIMLAIDTETIPTEEMASVGVADYLTFEEDESYLFSLVRRAMGRKRLSHEKFSSKKEGAKKSSEQILLSKLTKKEREVLKVLTMESNNEKMADILGIKPATVITHKKHLIKKLGVRSTAELIIYSFKHKELLA